MDEGGDCGADLPHQSFQGIRRIVAVTGQAARKAEQLADELSAQVWVWGWRREGDLSCPPPPSQLASCVTMKQLKDLDQVIATAEMGTVRKTQLRETSGLGSRGKPDHELTLSSFSSPLQSRSRWMSCGRCRSRRRAR